MLVGHYSGSMFVTRVCKSELILIWIRTVTWPININRNSNVHFVSLLILISLFPWFVIMTFCVDNFLININLNFGSEILININWIFFFLWWKINLPDFCCSFSVSNFPSCAKLCKQISWGVRSGPQAPRRGPASRYFPFLMKWFQICSRSRPQRNSLTLQSAKKTVLPTRRSGERKDKSSCLSRPPRAHQTLRLLQGLQCRRGAYCCQCGDWSWDSEEGGTKRKRRREGAKNSPKAAREAKRGGHFYGCWRRVQPTRIGTSNATS